MPNYVTRQPSFLNEGVTMLEAVTWAQARPFALLVDTNALAGLDLADALECAGYEVAGPIRDATDALVWFEQWAPCCAILDLPSLGQEGIALAQALRKRGVPFLIHSAHRRQELIDHGLEDAPWIAKPAMAADIVAMLDAIRTDY